MLFIAKYKQKKFNTINRLLIIGLFLSAFISLMAQRNPQAALHITAPDKGVLLPKVFLTNSNTLFSGVTATSSHTGMMVFNTNTATNTGLIGSGHYVWEGSSWIKIKMDNDNNSIINDTDIDTKIETEKNLDEDYIRFYTAGSERMIISDTGNVGIGTSGVATSSAILELNSTTQGFVLPRMTSAQMNAISNPTSGLMLFCTDCALKGIYFYNGNSFKRVNGYPVDNLSFSTDPPYGFQEDFTMLANTVLSTQTFSVLATNNSSYSQSSIRFNTTDLLISNTTDPVISYYTPSTVTPTTVSFASGESEIISFSLSGLSIPSTHLNPQTFLGTFTKFSTSVSDTNIATSGQNGQPSASGRITFATPTTYFLALGVFPVLGTDYNIRDDGQYQFKESAAQAMISQINDYQTQFDAGTDACWYDSDADDGLNDGGNGDANDTSNYLDVGGFFINYGGDIQRVFGFEDCNTLKEKNTYSAFWMPVMMSSSQF